MSREAIYKKFSLRKDLIFGFAFGILKTLPVRAAGKIHEEAYPMKYVCNLCGWVYDEDEAGVKWEDLPEDFACELCGVGKDQFSPEE